MSPRVLLTAEEKRVRRNKLNRASKARRRALMAGMPLEQKRSRAHNDAIALVQHAYDTGRLTGNQMRHCLEVLDSRNPA